MKKILYWSCVNPARLRMSYIVFTEKLSTERRVSNCLSEALRHVVLSCPFSSSFWLWCVRRMWMVGVYRLWWTERVLYAMPAYDFARHVINWWSWLRVACVDRCCLLITPSARLSLCPCVKTALKQTTTS